MPAHPGAIDRALLEELWCASDAAGWGLARDDFDRILLEVGAEANYGLAVGAAATHPSDEDPSLGTSA